MSGAWSDTPVHFIDFEGNQRSGILEYGIATVQHGRVVATCTRLCAPLGRVRPDETAVHGLAETDLRGARPISEDWEHFAGLRETGPFAAHFSGTENSLLKSVWPYPRACPHFGKPGETSADWGPWIDTAPLAQEFLQGLGSAALEALVQQLGLQAELDVLAAQHCPETRRRYHAALYDALAGAAILCALAKMPACSDLSLARLIVLSTRDADRRDSLQQGTLF